MSKHSSTWVGGIGGFLFGLVMFAQDPRPLVCVVLGAPLMLVCRLVDSMHVTPTESLIPLFFIVPMWFVYWTGLGAVIGRSGWWGCHRLAKRGEERQ